MAFTDTTRSSRLRLFIHFLHSRILHPFNDIIINFYSRTRSYNFKESFNLSVNLRDTYDYPKFIYRNNDVYHNLLSPRFHEMISEKTKLSPSVLLNADSD